MAVNIMSGIQYSAGIIFSQWRIPMTVAEMNIAKADLLALIIGVKQKSDPMITPPRTV